MDVKEIGYGNLPGNIKMLRERRGWSQYQLAEKMGVTQTSISQYESGETTPRMPKIEKLASLFGVTVPELLTEINDSDSTLRRDEIALVANYRKLNEEGRKMVLHAVYVLAHSEEYAE